MTKELLNTAAITKHAMKLLEKDLILMAKINREYEPSKPVSRWTRYRWAVESYFRGWKEALLGRVWEDR